MEDVVLHYHSGPAEGLSSLLETTEKLLAPFTCRTPPVFTPWFPTSAGDPRLPLRPARPAPRITSADVPTVTTCQTGNRVQRDVSDRLTVRSEPPPEQTEDPLCVSETPDNLLPDRDPPTPGQQPDTVKEASPVSRSWSVFTQRRALLQTQSLSKRFRVLVSLHGLHLRQRARWVLTRDNCRDIDTVWRSLSRSIRSSRLPSCNANIQRERAEIWVFCDVLFSEQVGRFLKDELQLSGTISLSVRELGDIFSL
ncbi:shieldin complex subunit 3 [Austrofundulus limnaeus]|uniref:Uncharacterized protein LOC106527781 n=1 Tax=Austrofundulus limnaeus TaxID=52670 RepID=A0A2I4CE14_AUSLI|nr:PREDICTED: uncharacterized protein LOC106527781 [Austrofundulus limnaeus]XP_013878224.1 PREDICTED: uncharacterized protein LOC106527781 [Austrofundulus limnaeus]